MNIGAPGSIARYASEAAWGDNEWAVFEYVQGEAVVRAAGTEEHCREYLEAGRFLVDVRTFKKRVAE